MLLRTVSFGRKGYVSLASNQEEPLLICLIIFSVNLYFLTICFLGIFQSFNSSFTFLAVSSEILAKGLFSP